MGNYASCALTSTMGKNKAPKVIFPTGEIKQLQQPTSAAELMFEIPNYFIVNSKSMQIGKRFSALNADEDLEMGNVYVMFGMGRVNSFVTAADMGCLFLAAKRGSNGKVRVVPAYTNENVSPAREDDAQEEQAREIKAAVEELLSEFKLRKSVCRSKKPVLETIVEEPIYSRQLLRNSAQSEIRIVKREKNLIADGMAKKQRKDNQDCNVLHMYDHPPGCILDNYYSECRAFAECN